MKTLFTIIFSALAVTIFAQQRYQFGTNAVFENPNDSNHTSIRNVSSDTLQKNLSYSIVNSNKIVLAPLISASANFESSESDLSNNIAAGLAFQYKPSKKILFSSQILGINRKLPTYEANYYDTLPYSSLYTNLLNNGNQSTIINFCFDFKYQLSKVFSLNFGNGKTFLGEGYRSLLISDQGVDAPYIGLTADLKKVKYLFRINRWQQNTAGNIKPKYSAMHYLSWDIKNRLNISLFETVVWEAKDSVRPRGMEWTYINPVLFFRPAEFSLGSPDNMLLGGQISYRFGKSTKIYTQVILDEFYLSEIKNWGKYLINKTDSTAKHGAWVNKHGFQFGIKSKNMFKIDGLNALAEFNYVRPYTYSHVRVGKTYTHNNQSVAHPYGANFSELLFKVEYRQNRYAIILSSSIKNTGYDSTGTHFGQDILQSTFDCPTGQNNIVVTYYGNEVGQGIKANITHGIAEFRYMVNPRNPIWLRLGGQFRHESINGESKNYISGFAGILINMFPDPEFMR